MQMKRGEEMPVFDVYEVGVTAFATACTTGFTYVLYVFVTAFTNVCTAGLT